MSVLRSYIADLDPHYIRALTETATFHQAAFLKGAIWKYLARQTSIRVNIPVRARIPVIVVANWTLIFDASPWDFLSTS